MGVEQVPSSVQRTGRWVRLAAERIQDRWDEHLVEFWSGHRRARERLRKLGAAVVGLLVLAVPLVALRALDGGGSTAPASVRPPLARSGASVAPDLETTSTGPGLTSPGLHLTVAPEASGELEVSEHLLAPGPITTLSVAPPPPPVADAGGPPPRVVGLQVAADGVPVGLPWGDVVDSPREVTLPAGTTSVELRYRVLHSAASSVRAAPGRATLSLRPAAALTLPSAPVVVEVTRVDVHHLICLDEPPSVQLCGVSDRDGWHTRAVTGASSHVLALVDLPPSPA